MWSSTLQVNWKQRFFVPTEEEPGIAILAAILEQFPIIAAEDDEAEGDVQPAPMHSSSTMQLIDLETWIVETEELHRFNGEKQQPIGRTESDCEPTRDESESPSTHSSQSACLPSAHHGCVPAMLQTLPPDYRSPAVQIGFNFAESESV
jgi:hypothetical protein